MYNWFLKITQSEMEAIEVQILFHKNTMLIKNEYLNEFTVEDLQLLCLHTSVHQGKIDGMALLWRRALAVGKPDIVATKSMGPKCSEQTFLCLFTVKLIPGSLLIWTIHSFFILSSVGNEWNEILCSPKCSLSSL